MHILDYTQESSNRAENLRGKNLFENDASQLFWAETMGPFPRMSSRL